MKLLSDNYIREILELDDMTSKVKLSKNDVDTIVDMYNRVINDDVHKTKGVQEQESMVTYMANSIRGNEDLTMLENHFSDNKHMTFFQSYMTKENYTRMRDMFSTLKVPTSILRGYRAGKENNIPTSYIDENGKEHKVRVHGYTNFSPDGTEDENDFLDIYIDGVKVYSMKDSTIDGTNLFNSDIEDEFEQIEQEKQYKEIRARNTTKSNKPTKSTFIQSYVRNSNGDFVTIDKRLNSAGKVQFQDRKTGRFVSSKGLI